MGKEHTSKDRKISLDEALDLTKKKDQHTSMLLKIFNMGKNDIEKKRFRELYMTMKISLIKKIFSKTTRKV